MEAQTPYHASTSEQTVICITRKLTPERVEELVDIARFLEFRVTERYDEWVEIEDMRVDQADDADQRWDKLLARPEAKWRPA